MVHARSVTINGGLQIVVPDSLDCITTYVLLEQNDFFEQELPFVRRLVRPGDHAIDVGANYGVYTLSLALTVGALGRIWAFEPGAAAAEYLTSGVAANQFSHVTVVKKAVSHSAGSAFLAAAEHAELRSLVHGAATNTHHNHEAVVVVSLDDCMDSYGWRDIAFIKIDAEGEESNIIRGARRLLSKLNPLIQYEIRAGANFNLDLVREFLDLEYASYRLVPGLGLAVPFDLRSSPDPYLLNLFCCKPNRAQQLAERGLMLRGGDIALGNRLTAAHAVGPDERWRDQLTAMPYAVSLSASWASANCNETLAQALAAHVRSRDQSVTLAERFCWLRDALSKMRTLCDTAPSNLRLLTLARIATDYGERGLAVRALTGLLARLRHGEAVTTSEPFLAPAERFERLAPSNDFLPWLIAGILELLEGIESFSSFYAGPNARDRLRDIKALGLGSPEMDRRLQLVEQRYAAKAPLPHSAT